MRDIELNLSEDFRDSEYAGNQANVEIALGYLSMWGYGSDKYVTVSIRSSAVSSQEENATLVAYYKDRMGNVNFVMVGVRNENDGSYSFHS
jgi:hypothetical protein